MTQHNREEASDKWLHPVVYHLSGFHRPGSAARFSLFSGVETNVNKHLTWAHSPILFNMWWLGKLSWLSLILSVVILTVFQHIKHLISSMVQNVLAQQNMHWKFYLTGGIDTIICCDWPNKLSVSRFIMIFLNTDRVHFNIFFIVLSKVLYFNALCIFVFYSWRLNMRHSAASTGQINTSIAHRTHHHYLLLVLEPNFKSNVMSWSSSFSCSSPAPSKLHWRKLATAVSWIYDGFDLNASETGFYCQSHIKGTDG